MSPEEKIEAAQKLINEAKAELTAKKRNWPEKIEAGMLFESEAFGAWISLGKYGFACISGDRTGSHAEEISGTGIAYLGHARDILTIRTNAHEPTGAELVGKICQVSLCPINKPDDGVKGLVTSFDPAIGYRTKEGEGVPWKYARFAQ